MIFFCLCFSTINMTSSIIPHCCFMLINYQYLIFHPFIDDHICITYICNVRLDISATYSYFDPFAHELINVSVSMVASVLVSLYSFYDIKQTNHHIMWQPHFILEGMWHQCGASFFCNRLNINQLSFSPNTLLWNIVGFSISTICQFLLLSSSEGSLQMN